jgi:hypothetical protein
MTESAIKPLIEPGTHRCRWRLSKPPDPTTWTVDGDLIVVPGRQPQGGVYGRAPANWTISPRGGKRSGWPQYFEYPVMFGELNGGLDLILLDARLSVLSEDLRGGFFSNSGANARFDSWVALVGRRAPQCGPVLVDSALIQISHLEAFAGASPITDEVMPLDPPQHHNDPTWSATFDKASTHESSDSGATVTLSYQGSAEVGGWYRFGVIFSPVVEITVKKPIPLADFLQSWVWPLRELVSAATGQEEKLTYLSCSIALDGDDRPPSQRRFQVFHPSVIQEPYASSNDFRDKDVSAIRIAEGESLLSLLRKWQGLSAEQNPILNTYEASALGSDQTPRARFLLLLQALEGLHGHENRYGSQQEKFEGKRAEVLAKCESLLQESESRFIKRFLSRFPSNLENVLREMLESLPVDLQPELAETELVREVIADPDTNADTTLSALRIARNNLSHGTTTFDAYKLHHAAGILERAVRGHLLRLLDATEAAQRRVLQLRD